MTRLLLLSLLVACNTSSPTPKPQASAEPAATSTWQMVASAGLPPPVDAGPGESYSITAVAPDAGPVKKDASAPTK